MFRSTQKQNLKLNGVVALIRSRNCRPYNTTVVIRKYSGDILTENLIYNKFHSTFHYKC